MLMCGIIDALEQTLAAGDLISYFFCQTSEPRNNNATAVLRGLIHHLIGQQPSLVRYVRLEYDRVGDKLFNDANTWTALSKIIISMLGDSYIRQANIYLIIDALDECIDSDDRRRLLELIVQISRKLPHTKCIISSRGWNDIRDVLTEHPQMLHLQLDPKSEAILDAVDTYIEHKVKALTDKKRLGPSDAETIRDYLKKNAGGTFLWVALVCKRLEFSKRVFYEKDMQAFPPGLEQLYGRMLQQVQNLDEPESKLYKFVLGVVLTSPRPLETYELAHLVKELDQVGDKVDMMRDIIRECGSFLSEQSDEVLFVHQSAKDYLLGHGKSAVCPDGEKALRLHTLYRSIEVLITFTREQTIKETPDPEQFRYFSSYRLHAADLRLNYSPQATYEGRGFRLAVLLEQCDMWSEVFSRREVYGEFKFLCLFIEQLSYLLWVCIYHQVLCPLLTEFRSVATHPSVMV